MLTLRCTQKLMRRLKVPTKVGTHAPTTVLGDWYANLIYARPQQLVLCMNERSSSLYARLKNMKRAITLKPPKTTSAKTVDRDNPPWSEEMLGPPVMRRGRGPQKAPTKVLTSLRLDADVIAFFRAQGAGYQSRINDALRRVKERGLTAGSTATARKRAAR